MYQPAQQQNKILTPGNDLPYLLSEKPEGKGRNALLKVINIRSWQTCPICNGRFKDTGNDLACLKYGTHPTKYYIEFWHKGDRYPAQTFNLYNDALKKAASIELEIDNHTFNSGKYKKRQGQVVKKYRFNHLYKEWLKQRKRDLDRGDIAPSYYSKLEQYGKAFVDFFGSKDVRSIKMTGIRDFRDSLPSSLKAKTQKNKIDVLRKFFNDLVDDEVLEQAPKFPKIKIESTIPKWIGREDQMKILYCIPFEQKPIFEFLIETGLRPAEARALKWDAVENERVRIQAGFSNGIYREKTKTKNQWTVPMMTQLKPIFAKVQKSEYTDFVFWHGKNKPYSEKKIIKIWYDACDNAKVKRIKLYNGTRHSFASQQVSLGKSLMDIGGIMGHKNEATTAKYACIDKEVEIRRAFEK